MSYSLEKTCIYRLMWPFYNVSPDKTIFVHNHLMATFSFHCVKIEMKVQAIVNLKVLVFSITNATFDKLLQ